MIRAVGARVAGAGAAPPPPRIRLTCDHNSSRFVVDRRVGLWFTKDMEATHLTDPNTHPALAELLKSWKGLEIEDLEILAWQIAQNLDLVGQIVGCAQGIHGPEAVADQLVQDAPATCAEAATGGE